MEYRFNEVDGNYGNYFVVVDMTDDNEYPSMTREQMKKRLMRQDATGLQADDMIDYAVRLFEENNETEAPEIIVEDNIEATTIMVRSVGDETTDIEIFFPYEPATVNTHVNMVVTTPHEGTSAANAAYLRFHTKTATQAQIEYALYYLRRLDENEMTIVGDFNRVMRKYIVVDKLPKDANRRRAMTLKQFLSS